MELLIVPRVIRARGRGGGGGLGPRAPSPPLSLTPALVVLGLGAGILFLVVVLLHQQLSETRQGTLQILVLGRHDCHERFKGYLRSNSM